MDFLNLGYAIGPADEKAYFEETLKALEADVAARMRPDAYTDVLVMSENLHCLATFTVGQAAAIVDGTWMPDIVKEFSKWWAATLFRHGLITEVKMLNRNLLERRMFLADMRYVPFVLSPPSIVFHGAS